jgi:Cullin, a subunit of E3 ubiquitin ligase
VGIKRWLGLDGIDLAIHVGVTVCVLGIVGVTGGPDTLFPVITMGSLVALGFRRKGLRRSHLDQVQEGDRLAEVEERVAYLEGMQDRVMELEERLDFAERMLTKQQNERLPG